MAKAAKVEVARTATDIHEEIATTFDSLAGLYRELGALDSLTKSDTSSEDIDDVAESTPKSTGKAATKPVVAKPAGSGKKTKTAPAITFDDVKTKMTDLMNTKGKEVTKTILSEFGVGKLVELEESSYADIVAKIDEAMAEDEAPDEDEDLFGEE